MFDLTELYIDTYFKRILECLDSFPWVNAVDIECSTARWKPASVPEIDFLDPMTPVDKVVALLAVLLPPPEPESESDAESDEPFPVFPDFTTKKAEENVIEILD
jgi:hypothetical protein